MTNEPRDALDEMERALRDAARVAIDGKVNAFEVRMMMRLLGAHGFVVVPSTVPCDACERLVVERDAARRRVTDLETALRARLDWPGQAPPHVIDAAWSALASGQDTPQ